MGDIDISKDCDGDTCFSKAGAFQVACMWNGTCGVALDTSRTGSSSDDNWLGNAQMVFLRDDKGQWYVDSLYVDED